jgi:hypothetical protein
MRFDYTEVMTFRHSRFGADRFDFGVDGQLIPGMRCL